MASFMDNSDDILMCEMTRTLLFSDEPILAKGLESVLASVDGFQLTGEDVAVKARIKLQGEHEPFYAEPIFLIRNKNEVGRAPAEVNDLGVRIFLLNIFPQTNEFLLGTNARQKDWVVIKALEKPYINVLWLGTAILMIGFGIAAVRRIKG